MNASVSKDTSHVLESRRSGAPPLQAIDLLYTVCLLSVTYCDRATLRAFSTSPSRHTVTALRAPAAAGRGWPRLVAPACGWLWRERRGWRRPGASRRAARG